MDRCRRQVRLHHDSGFPKKRDTPLKSTRRRRDRKRRLLPNKRFDTLVEECEDGGTSFPEGRKAGAALANTAPLHRISVSCFKPHKKPATPIGHQQVLQTSIKASPMHQSFGAADTPENVTSCSMETNSTFSSEENGDSRSSSSSAISSSYPSPEIFRTEVVETQTFLKRKEMLGITCKIKNSTLLDVSHAESIHTYHPPNMSSIIDTSTHVAEKNNEISYQKETHSENKSPGTKNPQNFIGRRPNVCRKRVSFKSPIITEPLKEKYIPSPPGINYTISKLSEVPEQTKPDAKMPKIDEISSEKATTVMLKRPVDNGTEKAKFFHFASSSERDALFQNTRDRSAKLRRFFYFPFTVCTQSPLYNNSRSELT